MAKKHWQIVHHHADGSADEGGFRTFPIDRCRRRSSMPACAPRASSATGSTGSTSRRRADGVFIIEINDNPNLEHGVEDLVGKADLWNRLTRWFTTRILD